MKKISVVIPLYNSENTINYVIDELESELPKLSHLCYEIILVNDCGPDNVLEVVKKRAAENSNIKVLNLAKNVGQTLAMFAGFEYASGDYIVNMDDDYQTPGYEIKKMVAKLEKENLDVIFAKYEQQKQSAFRRLGSRINAKMAEAMAGKPKGLRSNAFFVIRSFVKDEILKYKNNYPYVFGIIYACTCRIANVYTDHRPRKEGKSNYSFRRLFGLWANGFLSFSIKPLRLCTAIGSIIAAISCVIAIVLIIGRIHNPDAPLGWTSTIVVIMFFAGVQLISIGLLGEYLGRLYISSSNLPRYIVRESYNIEKKE